MPVHIHTMRSACLGAIGLMMAMTVLAWENQRPAAEIASVPVTGRATCGGRPLGGMGIVFQPPSPPGFHSARTVRPAGSFRARSWTKYVGEGVVPGTYRVYFEPDRSSAVSPWIDSKYQDPRTTNLLVHVGPDWNDFSFSLPDPARGATLVQNR